MNYDFKKSQMILRSKLGKKKSHSEESPNGYSPCGRTEIAGGWSNSREVTIATSNRKQERAFSK